MWKLVTISDIAHVQGGKRLPKGHKLQNHVTEYPYISVRDFTEDGTVDATTVKYLAKETYSQIKRYTISNDDVFISIAGTIGKTGIIPDILDGANLTENACKLVLKEGVDKRYIYYFTKSDSFIEQAIANTRVAAQPKLALERLKAISLRVPPLQNQQTLVAILDEAFEGIDAAIANTQEILAAAHELFESHLNRVFSEEGVEWERKKVSDIAQHNLGKMLDKHKNKGNLKPYLRNINVRWFYTDIEDVLEMRFEEHETQRYSVQKGDLLICEGGYPGRATIWDRETPIYFQKAIHRVRCYNPLHNEWLMYFLYSADASGALTQHFTGAGIQHLTGKALARIELPIAPDQRLKAHLDSFKDVHRETMRLEVVYQQKLNALHELKQSILAKAFRGELTQEEIAA